MLNREICHLYRELPISVLIFKEKELIHINKHLLEMFSIDELLVNLNEIKSEIYYTIFEHSLNSIIENDSDLFNLLIERLQLTYKLQHIQIDTHHLHHHTIFVLTLIRPEDISVILPIHNLDDEQKVLDLFTKTRQRRFQLFSMYKGLHIKSDALLSEVSGNQLIFKVSKKHLSSYHDNNEFIIIPSQVSEKVIVANALKVDASRQLLYLSNLQVMHHSAKDRKTIRIKCLNEAIYITFQHDQSYPLYDLSLFSLSIICERDDRCFSGKPDKSYALAFTLQHNEITSEITIDATLEKIMTLSDQRKVIFTFSPNEHAFAMIRNYINFRQMELLRELKRFVEQVGTLSD